jgi:hypothetical protein
MIERRWKALDIDADLLLDLFRGGLHPAYQVLDGIPEDARVVSVDHTTGRNLVRLIVESQEFEPLMRHSDPPGFFGIHLKSV